MTRPLALIMEDDPKIGMIYETTLQQAGYDTFLDKEGNQILDKLAQSDPALVILDMHVPYASGAEIIESIRANERWADLPVILSTADLLAARALQGKASYVLAKPVSVGRLLEIIGQLQQKSA